MNPRWNGREWTADIAIPPWSAFTGGRDMVPATFITQPGTGPAQIQVRSLESLPTVAAPLLSTALVRMREYYDSLRPKYAAFARRVPSFMGDPDIAMPASPDADAFVRLHELQGLFVLLLERDGLAYVGFSFRATWEPEHGLGLMTHGTRVVRIGGADASFALDAAEDDLAGA
jgi:hypothetical protein